MKAFIVTILLCGSIYGGLRGYWYEYWKIREAAYVDAVQDVRLYENCFGPSVKDMRDTDWPSPKYMRTAAHFVKTTPNPCDDVVNIDGLANGYGPK